MRQNSVVITGVGVVSSIGLGADRYFDALMQRRSGIRSLSDRTDDGAKPGACSDPAGLWMGGAIVDFDPKPHVRPRKALKVMSREIQTAFVGSQLAIIDADLESSMPCSQEGRIKPNRVGAVFGSEMMYGPPRDMIDPITECIDSQGEFDPAKFGAAAMRGVMPLWMLKYLPNMPACHVGIASNAHGPNNSLILGDVSGPAALMESASCVRRGIADLMITGATGTRINTTRLNYRNDLPIADVADPISHSSRPHDPASAGVVGGEGAAALIIESSQHANNRGATPIARIVGMSSRFVASSAMRNGKRSSDSQPERGRGSADAVALAIASAIEHADQHEGFDHSDIGAIISHAMGDPSIDSAEQEALHRSLPGIPIVAPMASIGHTGAATGAIAIATAALSLKNQRIPPTLHAEQIETVNLLSEPKPLHKPCILCLAHTSEGNATAVILAKP